DLRVVRRNERPALAWNESTSDVPTELAANRNILKVRIARRQTASCGDGLAKRRVHARRLRMNVRWQRIDVRALELRDLAILHQQHGELMPFVRKLLQDTGVR